MRRPSLAALAVMILAAGCLQSPPPASSGGPSDDTLVGPAHSENESAGFFIEGDESVGGFIPPGGVTFTFHAVNRGADAQAIWDPCGEGNPSIAIHDANGTKLDLTGPRFRCMIAVSWQPYAQGAELWTNLTWNGTQYHGEAASKAPPGKYDAVATFHAKRGEAETKLLVTLPVDLLDESVQGGL
ncbi:MAG: hypothetical protein WDA16_02500 [Candidatus Thermoplasmatota archaeon]